MSLPGTAHWSQSNFFEFQLGLQWRALEGQNSIMKQMLASSATQELRDVIKLYLQVTHAD